VEDVRDARTLQPGGWGAIDYFAGTFWPQDEVAVWDLAVRGFLQPIGASDADFEDTGLASRGCQRRFVGPYGLTLLDYGDQGFWRVEAKGEYCSLLDDDGAKLLAVESHAFGVKPTRIDAKWDGFSITPDEFHSLMKGGFYRSRSAMFPEFRRNEMGSTAYTTPRVPKVLDDDGQPKKLSPRDRLLRVYDWRGPVRAEFEMHGAAAQFALAFMSTCPVSEWDECFRGMLAAHVTLLEYGSDPLDPAARVHPRWAEFIDGVKPKPVPGVRSSSPLATVAGSLDGSIAKASNKLMAAIEAYGQDWLLQRIKFHADRKSERAFFERREFVEQLRAIRGCGLAGVPERSDIDDLPI